MSEAPVTRAMLEEKVVQIHSVRCRENENENENDVLANYVT